MEKGTDFASLPREMAVKIFGLLSIEELKTCVQVHDLLDMNIFNDSLTTSVPGVSSLVGYRKQPYTLEEPHVFLFDKTHKIKFRIKL